MSLLDIKDVDISYGKNLTVKKVSMSLEKGEICSIVGESGSGKTTVIRAAMWLRPMRTSRKRTPGRRASR